MHIHFTRDAFNDVYYPLLDDETRTQIIFGGSASGKSVFKAQDVIYSLLSGGRNWLCVRNIAKYIRVSIFNELIKLINTHGLSRLFKINQSEMSVTCANGHQALMAGLDDVEKIKSITPRKGIITDIWIEEATEVTDPAKVKQLEKRLRGKSKVKKRIHLTFNPILQTHWIYEKYFKGRFADNDTTYRDDNLLILKTTYKDNNYLEQDDIYALENESDEYFYNVYTLGKWGILGDRIFTNWQTADLQNDPIVKTFDIFKNGLDFGYSNDPTALTRSYYHRGLKRLYIVDEYNAKGKTNDILAQDLKPIVGAEPVVCDSAEPKSIQELCNYQINAIGAIKGKDSVNHGIQWLKQQEIIIDKRLQNTINEFQLYHWKRDKDGNVHNVPVDRNNHHIDALRYAFEDEMLMGDDTLDSFGSTLASNWDG